MSKRARRGVSERKQRLSTAKRRSNIVALLILAITVSVLGVGAYYAVGYMLSIPAGSDAQHRAGQIVMHIHPKVRILILGRDFVVPANIGIEPSLWRLTKYNAYGMTGMSPLHTHDTSGTIHVESTVVRDYTLGDFFEVWAVTFNDQCILQYCNDGVRAVKVFVNGQRNHEFRDLVLRDGQDILIVYE